MRHRYRQLRQSKKRYKKELIIQNSNLYFLVQQMKDLPIFSSRVGDGFSSCKKLVFFAYSITILSNIAQRKTKLSPLPVMYITTVIIHRIKPHCKENPIYVFLFWKLCGLRPNFRIHVSVNDLYIPKASSGSLTGYTSTLTASTALLWPLQTLSCEILPTFLQKIYFYCSYSSKTFLEGHERAFRGHESAFRGRDSAFRGRGSAFRGRENAC